jgi:cytochrome b561
MNGDRSQHTDLAALALAGAQPGREHLAIPAHSAQAAFLRIHAPVGLLILAMMLFRLMVRLQARALPPPPFKRPFLNSLLRLYHHGLYITVLMVPLFGLATTLRAGQARALIGLTDPVGGGQFIDDPMFIGHALATTLLSCLIVAHVLGALVHRFVWRDGVFDRMIPSDENSFGNHGS